MEGFERFLFGEAELAGKVGGFDRHFAVCLRFSFLLGLLAHDTNHSTFR